MERLISGTLDRLGLAVRPSHRNRVIDQISGFAKTLLGAVGAQASTYLVMVLMTRLLGVERFGQFGAIQATLTAAFGLSTLGIGVTATRYIAQYRQTDPMRTGRIIGLCNLSSLASGLFFTLILFACAGMIARHIFHSEDLRWAIQVTSICSLLMTVNANQIGTLMGFQAFGRQLRAQVLQSIASVIMTYLLVGAYGFDGAVLSFSLSTLIGCLLLNLEIGRELKIRKLKVNYREAWAEQKILFNFALPAAASGVIGSAAVWMAQIMLVRSEAGMAEMGLWTAAASMRAVVLLGPSVLSRVSSPILSALHDHGRGDDYGKTMWSTAMASTAGALAVGLLVLLFGPWLLTHFGKDYARAAGLFPLVIGSAVVEAYACSISQALVAHRRLSYQLFIISLWGSTLMVIAWWGIDRYASSGLAGAYLTAWVSTAAGYTWIARRLIAARGVGMISDREGLEVIRA